MRISLLALASLLVFWTAAPKAARFVEDPSFTSEVIAGAWCIGAPTPVHNSGFLQLFHYRPTGEVASEFALAKFTQEGRLDRSWGSEAMARQLPGDPLFGGAVSSVSALPDGQALLFFDGRLLLGTSDAINGRVFRLDARGAVDPAYGVGGVVILESQIHSMVIDDKGAMAVATIVPVTGGRRLVFKRYDANGELDQAFGRRELAVNLATEVVYGWSILPSGEIEVASYVNSSDGNIEPSVRRFTDTTTYAQVSAATRLVPKQAASSFISPVVKVDALGRVIFAVKFIGSLTSGPTAGFSLLRFNPDGQQDRAFGGIIDITQAFTSDPSALVMRADGGWSVFMNRISSSGGFFPTITDAGAVVQFSPSGVQELTQSLGIPTTAGSAIPPWPGLAGTYRDDGTVVLATTTPDGGCTLKRVRSDTPRSNGTLVEYYHPSLDHYFITLDGLETGILDANPSFGWRRTGQSFGAWMPFQITGATRTCRFYGDVAAGPNSHFYVPEGQGCQALRELEAVTPAGVKAWRLEGITFSVREAFNPSCDSNLTPVHRVYNRGFERGIDSNHRYFANEELREAMVAQGWVYEGIAFCVPPNSSRQIRRARDFIGG
jgi:hypothetical protein